MAWDPPVDIGGDPRSVKVGASDVASNCRCGRFLALKTRPQVKTVDGWRKLWPPDDRKPPFPLETITNIVMASHLAHNIDTYSELCEWIGHQVERRGVHRLMRPFIEHAVENVIDAHDGIEADIGPLRLLSWRPKIGQPGRELEAWAPLYHSAEGVHEIRRLRLGPARHEHDEDDARWAVTAARIAAEPRGELAPAWVRVVEIGCVDGSIAVLFDDTPEQALSAYTGVVRNRAGALTEEDHVVPCSACGDCKTAGSCRALVPLDGLLGQVGRGHQSRSISPSELAKYAECPGRWLMESCAHLPKDPAGSEASERGRAVHDWLKAAHRRGTGCEPADLPVPGGHLGLATGVLDAHAYAVAYPFLLQHVGRCPLSEPGVTVVSVEGAVRGYDHDAEVVPVARPDLMYRRDDLLVVREVKTKEIPFASREEVFDRHLQIPFTLRMLESGLLAQHNCTTGVVEAEVITAGDQFVWEWRTDDPATMAVAASEVERVADDWHHDATWQTTPGPQCGSCPVRQWCPDRDVWQLRPAATAATTGADDAAPPF